MALRWTPAHEEPCWAGDEYRFKTNLRPPSRPIRRSCNQPAIALVCRTSNVKEFTLTNLNTTLKIGCKKCPLLGYESRPPFSPHTTCHYRSPIPPPPPQLPRLVDKVFPLPTKATKTQIHADQQVLHGLTVSTPEPTYAVYGFFIATVMRGASIVFGSP